VAQKDLKKELEKRVKAVLREYDCDRYLIFAGRKGETAVFYQASDESELVHLIILAILENLKDKPKDQEFVRTALLSAITGDAYGTGWWDRLKKVVDEIDQKGQQWFGRG